MKTTIGRFIPVLVIISALIIGGQPTYGRSNSNKVEEKYPTPELTVSRDGQVTCEFDKTEIRVVIKYFSKLTGQNFIIDEKVHGPISVIAPTAFPVEDALTVLTSILEMRGYTLVPSGDFMKVTPIDNDIITRIIDLEYADASAIRKYISSHISRRNSSIIAPPGNSSLIITGASSKINRIEKLIKALDKPSAVTDNINGLILRYSKLTGKNIIVGKIGRRQAIVFNPNGLSDEDLLNSMETIISTAGLIMEERGDAIVIEPDPDKMEEMKKPEDHPKSRKSTG